MYLERLLPENVRHLAPVEQVFSDGPQQVRRWTLLSAGTAATARLRCLALVGLGRWQLSRLAGRVLPVMGGPLPDHRRLFDDRADALLTELVRIVFRQNMKSMETYYRWLALQYAARCGRIHAELIDTLFGYNGRPRMGRFVARLEALCRQAPVAGDSLAAEGPAETWAGPN